MAAIDQATVDRWREDPAAFIEEMLADPETGKAYRLLPAERVFLHHAFKTDADGKLLYPEQVYAAPKKSGKTAFAAMHALVMTLLLGGRFAETTLCANDFEQSVGRVFEAVRKIVQCSPWLKIRAKVTSDKVVFAELGATIKAIPSDFAGAAGGNQNLAVFDELWGYTSEKARRLWDEMIPPPTRRIACRLTVTYAGFEDESELLAELYRRGVEQPSVGADLYAGDGLLMFWTHTPIAPWQDAAWLTQMRRSLRPNQYLRMIENRWVSTESSFIEMKWVDQCTNPAARPIMVDPSLQLYVGVDASVKHDSTALAGVTWDRRERICRLVTHQIFQPSPEQPLDFERTIERTIWEWKLRFKLAAVWFDPYQMQASAQRLRQRGVRMEEFPQTIGNLTASSQNLLELLRSGNISLYPDDEIRLAFSRATALESSRGWHITKAKAAHKIDIVIALGMAALAAAQQGTRRTMSVALGNYDGSYRSLGSDGDDAEIANWGRGNTPSQLSAEDFAGEPAALEAYMRWARAQPPAVPPGPSRFAVNPKAPRYRNANAGFAVTSKRRNDDGGGGWA